MNCYVCGFPRPEGANYCPGCGRYCADDPNVRSPIVLPPDEIVSEESAPEETPPFPEAAASEEANCPLPEETGAPAPPQQRRKRHRPVLIPVLIMAALFAVGSICWFLLPYPPDATDPPVENRSPGVTNPPLPAQKTDPTDPAGSIPAEAYAPTDEACFHIDNGAVSFVPERYNGSPILVIPSEIDGQTVTAIAAGGFSGLEDVTTLILPDTLETIGDSAFADCRKLRGVYIPDTVTTIGSSAFAGCIDMESVSVPAATEAIGTGAFHGCASLMYLFYEGTYEQWVALYNEYITPYTYAICSDGEYYHGVYNP